MSTPRKLPTFTAADLKGAQKDAETQKRKLAKYLALDHYNPEAIEALKVYSEAANNNVVAIENAITVGDEQAINNALAAGEQVKAASIKAKSSKDHAEALEIFTTHQDYITELARNLYKSFSILGKNSSNPIHISNFLNNLYFLNKGISNLIMKGNFDNWSMDKREIIIDMIYKDSQINTLKPSYKKETEKYLQNILALMEDTFNLIIAEDLTDLPLTSEHLESKIEAKEWNYEERMKHLAATCSDRAKALIFFLEAGMPKEEKSFLNFFNSNSKMDTTDLMPVDHYLKSFYSFDLQNSAKKIKIPEDDLQVHEIRGLEKTLKKMADSKTTMTPEELFITQQKFIDAYTEQYGNLKPFMYEILQLNWHFEGIKLADKKHENNKTETVSEITSPKTPMTSLSIGTSRLSLLSPTSGQSDSPLTITSPYPFSPQSQSIESDTFSPPPITSPTSLSPQSQSDDDNQERSERVNKRTF
jgi:hypothetical protein